MIGQSWHAETHIGGSEGAIDVAREEYEEPPIKDCASFLSDLDRRAVVLKRLPKTPVLTMLPGFHQLRWSSCERLPLHQDWSAVVRTR